MTATIRLPWGLQRRLESASLEFLHPQPAHRTVFSRPPGEEALIPADSVSWRIFKNPVSLFIGGVAAVLLELAEPHVRTGVWEHSTFRSDPLNRLRRTGLAAMITVYGARSMAEPMIARVVRMHARVAGETPGGASYHANDPLLLSWVHATAAFGFAHAYSRYVESLGHEDFDALYREGEPVANLYGAGGAPRCRSEVDALFRSMEARLTASPIVFRFLDIMRDTATFPTPFRWLQPVLVRAAVELLPAAIRATLGLTDAYGLRRQDRIIVEFAGGLANRIVLKEGPAAQSCLRLGLSSHYLYA
jgi:uncharacterized protein (DUF2236 family)